MVSIGSRESASCEQEYKVAVFFPVLDAVISQISRRFDQKNINVMHAIQAISPKSDKFLPPAAPRRDTMLQKLKQEMPEGSPGV